MTFRSMKVLALPASITLLSTFSIHPPQWLVREAANPVKPRLFSKPAVSLPGKLNVPRIVAVNARIAKRVNALRPTVKERLARVMRKLPRKVTLLVTSAVRTRAEQASLRSTFGVKARPGTSTHEDGRGIDINVLVDGERVSPRLNQRYIGYAMASEGFRCLGRFDPVHYSLPKDEIQPNVTSGPRLPVVTMDRFEEIEAHNEMVEQIERSGTAGASEAALPAYAPEVPEVPEVPTAASIP